MITLENLRHDKKAAILDLARLHGAGSTRVFGSVARGQATEQSDLDQLVEWEPDRSLLDVIGLKQDLEDLLGVTVDIGSERGLHWFVRADVLREAVPLWRRRVGIGGCVARHRIRSRNASRTA